MRRSVGGAEYQNVDWEHARVGADRYVIQGLITIHNPDMDREVMITDVVPEVVLLSSASLDGVSSRWRIENLDEEYPPRPDGYWTAYVVKPARYEKDRHVRLTVEVEGDPASLDALYAVHIDVRFDTYGTGGAGVDHHHIIRPLRHASPAEQSADWRDAAVARVLAVRTHLLSPFDDPVDVVRRYALPLVQPGDIVALGESPLAVMQGRFRDPRTMVVGPVASRLARFLSGEGSMGTATGLQALVDEVGSARVVAGLALGVIAKVAAGQDGWFYRVCGEQSRLVDDVTGSLAPYDKLIVLGPLGSDEVCQRIKVATGLEAAVVDANDLGKVDVVGSTTGVSRELIAAALRSNPAGNAAETTPLVLIRPT